MIIVQDLLLTHTHDHDRSLQKNLATLSCIIEGPNSPWVELEVELVPLSQWQVVRLELLVGPSLLLLVLSQSQNWLHPLSLLPLPTGSTTHHQCTEDQRKNLMKSELKSKAYNYTCTLVPVCEVCV